MRLNGLAGRSYNDLMQYPVLPFVLADYTARLLELHDPTAFRDLSRPVAVQQPEREKHYIATYNVSYKQMKGTYIPEGSINLKFGWLVDMVSLKLCCTSTVVCGMSNSENDVFLACFFPLMKLFKLAFSKKISLGSDASAVSISRRQTSTSSSINQSNSRNCCFFC